MTTVIIGIVAAIVYFASMRTTFHALRSGQAQSVRNDATFGITGMIVSGIVLGSVLERLLP